MRKGFSVVELIIVITIMAILIVLGTVNLRSSQANARDAERRMDVETIAQHLETFYKSGNDDSVIYGFYPSIDPSSGLIGREKTYLMDLDDKTLIAPDQTTSSLIAATNATQTTGGVAPQPTTSQYVYQPIKSDDSLCSLSTDECAKFNLYYKLEVATNECPAPNNICMVTSKNQ